jgi:hypothetical protein
MAKDKDIKINIKLNTGNAEESVKGIKTALRDAKNEALKFEEGSAGFTKAAERAGQLQDKLGDMNATIANLSGNSVQNLTSAFSKFASAGLGAFGAIQGAQALFGDENKDLQKTLVKMQAVMSLSNGIKEFADIGQSAKDFKGVIASLIPGLFAQTTATEGAAVATGTLNATMALNPAVAIALAIAALVAGLIYFMSASDDAAEAQERLNVKLDASNKLLKQQAVDLAETSRVRKRDSDNAIALLEAQGASEEQLLATKVAGFLKEDEEYKKMLKLKAQGLKGELTRIEGQRKVVAEDDSEENKKKLTETVDHYNALRDEYTNLYNDREQFDIKIRLAETQQNKKDNDEELKLQEEKNAKYLLNEKKRIQASGEAMLAEQKLREENEAINEANLLSKYAAEEEAEAARIKKSGEEMVAEQKARDDAEDAQIAADEELGRRELEIAQATEDAKYQMAQQGVAAIGGLSDLLFSIKGANLKKGSVEEEKAARTQFKINKAVSIASTIISTIQGVQNALSAKSVLPEPLGQAVRIATAIGVGIAGASNIAKISATQFQGGGGGGGSVPSAAGAGAGAGEAAAPAFSPQTFGINSGASGVNNNINGGGGGGNNQMRQRVYVVQTDIAQTNNQVEVLETRARF